MYKYNPNNRIKPDKPVCGVKDVTEWHFDHYKEKNSWFTGIWPYSYDKSELSKFKNKWGYSKVLANSANYSKVTNVGYTSNNIMLQLTQVKDNNLYRNQVSQFSAKYYYIDEPLYNGISKDRLIEVANYISSTRPGSVLMMGTWWYNPYLGPPYDLVYVVDHTNNTYIMCDQYDGDQRNLWTGFHDYIGERNPSNWVNTVRDGVQEFDQLIGHANNLGLKSLWLYTLDGNHDAIDDFSYYAWKYGWLRRFDRKYIYEYRCSFPDPCDCDPETSAGWYLYKIWETNDVREIFY